MKLFTIGFTKTSAERFFSRLSNAHVKKLIDVRLNNVSQLAGFAKKDDLRYFTKAISGIEYEHIPQLAPTQEILDEYKKTKGSWSAYAQKSLPPTIFEGVRATPRDLCEVHFARCPLNYFSRPLMPVATAGGSNDASDSRRISSVWASRAGTGIPIAAIERAAFEAVK